jgi:hypothetical protein
MMFFGFTRQITDEIFQVFIMMKIWVAVSFIVMLLILVDLVTIFSEELIRFSFRMEEICSNEQ